MKFDYQDFILFFTFLLFWVSIQFGQIIEDSIAYSIVLSIGIIHGSNDFTILKKQNKGNSVFFKSAIFYLLLMFLCVVSYLINAFISILFFIFLSSYHFGEQHLESKLSGSKFIKTIFYIFYGMLIFSLIFIENLNQVAQIMLTLTGSIIPEIWIKSMLVISSSVLVLCLLYELLTTIKSKINIARELFYLLILYLVFKTSSLILGFSIYFVLWHSVPSILDQIKFLSGQHNTKTILSYCKTAFIYWFISIIGIGIVYYFFSENLFNSIIFLVLFAVTTPHVWVMHGMKD